MKSFNDHYSDLLKDPTHTPVLGIRILAYYDLEGKLRYQQKYDVATDNIPVSQVIGILELAKADLAFTAVSETRASVKVEGDQGDWVEEDDD